MVKFYSIVLLLATVFVITDGIAQTTNTGDGSHSITFNTNPPTESFGQIPFHHNPSAVTITESTTQNVVYGNSVSCNSAGLHTDNSYFRSFVLTDFGISGEFNVTDVSIGVESATAGAGGTQPITCNLYTTDSPFPTGYPASLTLIGSANIEVPDQALTIFDIPVTGTAPAGSELVVEIFTPSGQTDGNSFFIGSNPDGESAPSYLLAADCGITVPTTTATIGFPDMMIVMNVTGNEGQSVIPISVAIEDLDMDFIPDHLDETVTIEGVVFSPNYQTSNNSFYITDGTAGTDIFMYSPPLYTWNMGDMLQITGVVSQYNGMTEIIPADSTGWVLLSTGNPTPDPIVLTLAEYKANPEMYEGSLVGFVSLNLASGTWPAEGSSANLQLTDGQDTVTFRIDSDTDIDGQPEPTWPVDVLGIGSQYDSSAPYDGGYQIFPRFYATDFLPAGTIPVELTSFTANVNENSVMLNWGTATETNNKGFEIQRNSGNGFMTIGFMPGHGTTTQPQSYSYTDQNMNAGHYTYRLKQIDFQGTYSFSTEVGVDVNSVSSYALEQNYPNPFNPSTVINFNLKVDSKVTLKVFNVLGQEVAQLLNGAITAGSHRVDFNASLLNSGVYFYRLEATGIDGSTFTSVKKMMLAK